MSTQDNSLSVKNAREWFLSNPAGSLTCINKRGESKLCSSLPEVEDFYKPQVEIKDCYCLDSPVSLYFELSYANFLTVPRLVMESMSKKWQEKMKALLDEMDNTFDWTPKSGKYYVQLWTNEEFFEDGDDGTPMEFEEAPLWNYRHGSVENLRKP